MESSTQRASERLPTVRQSFREDDSVNLVGTFNVIRLTAVRFAKISQPRVASAE